MTEILTDNRRLEPIRWLSQLGGAEINLDVIEQEARAQRIHQEYGVTPTIGAEVEVDTLGLFPGIIDPYVELLDASKDYLVLDDVLADLSGQDKQRLKDSREAYEANQELRFFGTFMAGIPRDSEACFWEFAHDPTYGYELLAHELDLLMEHAFIPTGARNPMHITLGGLPVASEDPMLILRGLELIGVSPERLIEATAKTGASWMARTSTRRGVRPRRVRNLKLGQQSAVELRSPATSQPEDHHKVFRAAQMLGTVLLAHNKQKHSRLTDHSALHEIASQWSLYTDILSDLWQSKHMPDNSDWGTPFGKAAIWQAWAACLAQRDETGSPQLEALQAIEAIVDRTEALLDEL